MSISKVVTFDIEPVRYRRILDIEAWNFDIDAARYRRNVDIAVQNFDIVIYRYRGFLDIDKCSFDICIRYRSICASMSNFVFFDIGVFLSDPAWAAYSVLDTDCCVHIALRINHHPWLMRRPGHPQPPQRRLHSAARPHQLHRAQHHGRSRRSGARPPELRPQPPERASTERRSA